MRFAVGTIALGTVAALLGWAGPRGQATPRKRPGQALTMDLVMQAVDRTLSSRAGRRYASPVAMRTRARGGDKTRAPYFVIPGAERGGLETLPLKSTSADVHIAGVIARVRVKQVYRNTGTKPIEAIYVFPGSTRAAVHGMRMRIGERVVEAKIALRDVARRRYERARRTGRRASLLEQQRANVFTMHVANIMPKDTIEVELDYSELLVPEAGVYEFVYPTVVGPRFAGGTHPRKDRWIGNPYLRPGSKVPYAFGLKVHLESPIGLKEVASPSHSVKVRYATKNRADLALKGTQGGNRDFVLRYRLAGDKIETGVMTYKEGNEQFFLMMMEPPKRVEPKQIPRREYIFVLDVSGSMYGFPLHTAKVLIKNLLRSLRPSDYFNVVLFAGSSYLMNRSSVPAQEMLIERAIQIIDHQRGGGGTQLLQALRTAYAIPAVSRAGVSRNVVVITDGYVGVEAQTFRFIRKHLGQANCYAFGIGSSVNRALIEGMARAGLGAPFVALNRVAASKVAATFRTYVEAPVLTDIEVAVKGAMAYDMVPRRPPDLLASRPLIVFGKYKGAGGTLRVTGRTGAGAFSKTLTLGAPRTGEDTRPLRVLWARKWVENLMDQLAVLPRNQDLRDAVASLGLTYNLLTRFTSFVAVDRVVANRSGHGTTVKQPLPLPHGVSGHAVGGQGPGSATPRNRRYPRTALKAPPAPPSAGSSGADEEQERKSRRVYAMPCSKRSRIGGCRCDAGGTPDGTLLLIPLVLFVLLRRRRGG